MVRSTDCLRRLCEGVLLDTLLHLLHYVFRSRQRHRGVCRLGRLCLSLRWAVRVKLFFPDLCHRIWDYGQELTAGAFFGVRVIGEAFAPAPASRESHKRVVLRDEVMALVLHRGKLLVLFVEVFGEQVDRVKGGRNIPANLWRAAKISVESGVKELAEDHVLNIGHLLQHPASEGMLDGQSANRSRG